MRDFLFKISLAILLLSCFSMNLKAQDPSLSIGNVGICNTPTVLVPLTGNNLTNIGSMTLYINFDDQSLTFSSLENIDTQLNGLLFNVVTNPSRLAIVWSNVNGAHFQNTVLLNLKFNVLHPASLLSFAVGCEIANVSLQIIPVNYINGSVYSSEPSISKDPENKTIKSQANAMFQVSSPDAAEFAWQESRNSGTSWLNLTDGSTYTGTHTASVTINHVPTNFNNFVYRCILKKDNCPATSNQATLTVDSVSGIHDQKLNGQVYIYNEPNPFSGNTTLIYNVPEKGNVTIELFALTGKHLLKLIEGPHIKGEYKIENNFVSLPTGIYMCKYVFTSSAKVLENQVKMIKIN
jgi:hypothetical protein